MTSLQKATAFLQTILPEEGFKCLTVIGARKFNEFHDTHEELARAILSYDGRGETVYHACAVYATRTSREASNVLSVGSLWLDVDTKLGHVRSTYADLSDAWRAVETFCNTVGIPHPLYVNSGRGLHCYWPLAEALDPREWKRYAEGLKRLTQQHGLITDPVRTADIASILRTPGTWNRKAKPFERVDCSNEEFPFIELSALQPLIAREILQRAGTTPIIIPLRTGEINTKLLDAKSPEAPSFATVAVEHCPQLRSFRDMAGVVSEPEWFNVAGVLAFCEDGDALFHAWSSGHPNYDPGETQSKLNRWDRKSGPTRCERFQGTTPDLCAACPHMGRIGSPVSLGRRPAQMSIKSLQAAELVLPSAFQIDHNGHLVHLGDGKNKEGKDSTLVSRSPIRLKARQRIENQEGQWKFLIEYYDARSGTWFELQADAASLLGQNVQVALAERGLIIHHVPLFRLFIQESIHMHAANKEPDVFYASYGWKRNLTAFLCGSLLYTSEGVSKVSGSATVRERAAGLGPAPGATLEEWRDAAQPLMLLGQEAQSVAVLASFAAPLMAFMSSTDGGAIYSMVTGASGQGKSFALAAAESVWGSDSAMRLTSTASKASRGVMLGLFTNLPVTWEEFSVIEPKLMGEEIRRFTDGRDKARAAGAKGGELAPTPELWQTILITTSNTSIVDTLASFAGDDAQSYRVFETELTMGKADFTKGEQILKQLHKHRGTAGDRYLRALTDPTMGRVLERRLERTQAALWERLKPMGFDRQHRYYIRFLTALQVATELVNHLDILEVDPERIVGWVVEQMQQDVVSAKPEDELKFDRALTALADYITAVQPSTLIVQEAWRPKLQQAHLGQNEPQQVKARLERDTMQMYLAVSPLFKWLTQHRINAHETLRTLRKHNVYIDDRMRTLTAGTNLPGAQTQCIVIDGKHPAVNMSTNQVLRLVAADEKEEVR